MDKHRLPVDPFTLDPATIPNEVLRRLIEEIQHEGGEVTRIYDRVHNRHNRGPVRRPWPPPPDPDPAPDEEEDPTWTR